MDDELAAVTAARLLQRFLDADDVEAAAWIRAGLRAWLAGEAETIGEALGLHSTARAVALELRNLWLLEAARHVPAATPWMQARNLKAEVRAFQRKAAAWSRLSSLPTYATAAQRCLFRAAQLGELPATAERLLAILNYAFSVERKVPIAGPSRIATNEGGNEERPALQPGAHRARARRRNAAIG